MKRNIALHLQPFGSSEKLRKKWKCPLTHLSPLSPYGITSSIVRGVEGRHHVPKTGPLLLGSVAVFGAATLVFGLSTHVVLSMVALAVTGAADMISVVIRQTLVQLETPDAMRGRVSAVNSLFIGGSNQLGEFESGATAAWLGPVGSVVLGGVGVLLVAAAWPRLFRALARRDALLPGGTGRPNPAD